MSNNQNGTTEEIAIRNLVENWASAVRRKDFAGILRSHSPNILMFDVPPPLQSKGIDAYKKTWDLFFSWSHDTVVFDIREMTVTTGSEVAFVTAVMRCSAGDTDGGQSELDFRLTVGLQKVDDEWLITHEHHSVPATS